MAKWWFFLMLPLICSCAMFQKKGVATVGKNSVSAVADAGKPATLATSDAKESFVIPKDTLVRITEHAATTTAGAYKTTELKFNSPTEWQKFEATVAANTGTVDTSVAIKKVEVAERRILLYIAIGCGIAGIVMKSMLPAWPALSNGLLLAAPLAFGAWKFAEVPAWAWFAVLVGVGLLAMGYKRSELDNDKDGIPDILQGKRPPVVVVTPPPETKV